MAAAGHDFALRPGADASGCWCGRRDLNPHGRSRWNLNPVRLPIPPRPPHRNDENGPAEAHPTPGRVHSTEDSIETAESKNPGAQPRPARPRPCPAPPRQRGDVGGKAALLCSHGRGRSTIFSVHHPLSSGVNGGLTRNLSYRFAGSGPVQIRNALAIFGISETASIRFKRIWDHETGVRLRCA
jgi:hypothetical protein